MHSTISGFFLPGCCLLCSRHSKRVVDLCVACEQDLPLLGRACQACAIPLSSSAPLCGACLQQPPPQDATRAAFRYAYPLHALVQRFKFNADHAVGNLLARLLTLHVPKPADGIVLLPVPLHINRLRERGFNQADVLAHALADRWRLQSRRNLLSRHRETEVQSNMNAAARRRNVQNAFALTPGVTVPEHVAIIDDVVTTGSTTREIAALLKKAGTRKVEVWALARTPGLY